MDIQNKKDKDIKDELIDKIAQNPSDENNYIEGIYRRNQKVF